MVGIDQWLCLKASFNLQMLLTIYTPSFFLDTQNVGTAHGLFLCNGILSNFRLFVNFGNHKLLLISLPVLYIPSKSRYSFVLLFLSTREKITLDLVFLIFLFIGLSSLCVLLLRRRYDFKSDGSVSNFCINHRHDVLFLLLSSLLSIILHSHCESDPTLYLNPSYLLKSNLVVYDHRYYRNWAWCYTRDCLKIWPLVPCSGCGLSPNL